jgi:pimeloyl-ACP methyl ester carboxylesterase
MTTRTLHVGLRVHDLESSLAFYQALGYRVVGRVPETPIGQLVMLKLAGDDFVTLELVHDPNRNPPAGDTHLSHLVIAVDSMAEFVAGLRGAGIDVGDTTSPDGTNDFLTAMVDDPDGNSIELVQWPAGHPIGMTAADFTDDVPRDLFDLRGVATWWDEHGTGEAIVLFHPGGADSRAWDPNVRTLAAHYRIFRYDRRGQGRTPDIGGPITFEDMTDDAINFLELVVGGPAHLVGHSIGAPIALLVARRRPELVRSIVFSEGVAHHDGWKPGVLDPLPSDAAAHLADLYGEVSPHGPDHWSSVWARLDAEHHRSPALNRDDLATIDTPTLLLFADETSEVAGHHIHELRAALPQAQLAIVPDTDHGLPGHRPDLFAHLVLAFLGNQP